MNRAYAFFDYARERYRILQRRRDGVERPWTTDKILQQYRFCNIFREDDTTTKWIREHVAYVNLGDHLLGAMIIARWFNRIETLERLLCPKGEPSPYWTKNLLFNFDHIPDWVYEMKTRLDGVQPLVTGAYMIKTPPHLSKLDGLLLCLGDTLPHTFDLQREFGAEGYTLEEATRQLQQFPYLGPFMAYEVVTDLRHTILSCAPDIMTWANPGPGAIRGAGRILSPTRSDHFSGSKADAPVIQELMRGLLERSQDTNYWPSEWPQWEMRDVEHTLCEFDKYERARLGEGTPKQRYQGA